MALETKLETEFGIDANYHKVVAASFDWVAGTGSATLFGYVDAAARHDGAEHITQSVIELGANTDFDIVGCYKAAKLDERFAAAKDV